MITINCDKCGKDLTHWIEKQEMFVIDRRGGYGSIFGDGYGYRIELCQKCLYDMLQTNGLIDDKFFDDPYKEFAMYERVGEKAAEND